MVAIWKISIDRLLEKLALCAVLLATLVVQGCTLPSSEQLEVIAQNAVASRPIARVELYPDTFCIGEMGTVTWDGGPQFADCDPDTPDPYQYSCGGYFGLPCEILSDTTDCKAASLYVLPSGATFTHGYDAYHLNGSASLVMDLARTYSAGYFVQWDGWADRRAYQRFVDERNHRFTYPTGLVSDEDTATPITADSYSGAYRDILVCDEATRTWRFGRAQDSSVWRGSDGEYLSSVDLSACVGITQICITETLVNALGRLQISVEGGPSIVLGGESGPRCTDVFRGYHPEDIQIVPLDRQQFGAEGPNYGQHCTPGEEHPWLGLSMLGYDVAPGTLCAAGPPSASWTYGGIENLDFGTVDLVGVSRDRCLASLDPLFLTELGITPPRWFQRA